MGPRDRSLYDERSFADVIDEAPTMADLIERRTFAGIVEERLAADSRTARTMRNGEACSLFDDYGADD